ncbi:iron-containing alcohol dehydrogenase [candidate division WOR-3 bacterium]|nr:iron-containing alcohol dehydrogenase [candidate division WOR-3 bacterium]
MKEFKHYLPTQIIFGKGKLKDLSNFLPPNIERILIVTGKHSSKKNGSLDFLKTSFKKLNKSTFIFDKVEQNPSIQTINKGAGFAREKSPDLVIGLGGGSVIDATKCIALLAKNDGKMEDYIKGEKSLNSPLPIVAIPTTAGTGSEVTQYAVLICSNTKRAYSNPKIFPTIALLDPELTISMPEEITINTGIDALTHAIEGYLSKEATPISTLLAIRAIKIIKEWLPRVALNGEDIEARTQMLYASMLAGLVIAQTKTIILHALGYPLTTLYNIPHGRANGILLPYVLEFLNDTQRTKISKIIEIFSGKDLDVINKFVNDLGISTSMKDYGITSNDIPNFVQDAWGRRNLKVTLKKVTKEDIANIYNQAL